MKPSFVWNIQQRVKQTMQHHRMIAPGSRVLVAVSGGPDSMVLTHIISHLMDEMDFQTRLCHVNHNLRGRESMEDERFVVQQTQPYVLPLTVRRFDWDEIEAFKQGNLEANARKLRYAKLIHTAIEFDCSPILTGHTQSDQAETVLQRLMRSTGLSGLSGILPVCRDMEIPIARPMLEITREEVVRYAEEAGLIFREDSMNQDPQFTRVRIRQKLIPFMRDEFNPNIEEALATLADTAREEEEFWQFHLLERLAEIGGATRNDPAERLAFLSHHPAEQRRLLREYARRLNLELSANQVEDMRKLLQGNQPQTEAHLSSGFRFYRRYEAFFLAREAEPVPKISEYPLEIPGSAAIPELGLEIVAQHSPANVLSINKQDDSVACLDADKLDGPLIVRTRLPGDSMVPLGMQGRKKVKKILQEKKVPREQRDCIPIVCLRDEIVWVGGLCCSERFRITPETQNVVQLEVKNPSLHNG